MSPTRYAARTVVNICIILCMMFIARAAVYFLNPMIFNEIAMTQMENTDTYVVLTGIYNTVRPVIKFVFSILIAGFFCLIGRDTYKFVKYFAEEMEKEN